jgi:hypothetical protein
MQRQLSRGLVEISNELDIPVILATHSAALLDDLSIETYRCSRDEEGHAGLTVVPRTDREALQRLGVPISEELHLYRAVLVVEGQHEAVLFDEMFGEEIAAYRIKVLPIRGTRQLRLLASAGEMLFRYLEAPFVLLTDRTRTEAVQQAYAAAASANGSSEVRSAIAEVFTANSEEEHVLQSLFITAAEAGLLHRLRGVHGLEKDDVLHYLPCEHLVPGSTWDQLVELHKQRGNNEPRDFKRWLELTRDADLSDDNLRSAVRLMDEVPREWTDVIDSCMKAASAP